MKRCTKCGETKPVAGFYRHKGSRDGLGSRCKACHIASVAAYQAANPDKIRARQAAYYAAHQGAACASARAYHAAHRDEARAWKAAWRAANPDKVCAWRAAWRAANPDRVRALAVKHSAIRRAQKSTTQVENVGLADVIRRDGRACYICGVETVAGAKRGTRFAAELDHVVPLDPNGKKGTHLFSNLRCACHPCNRVKSNRLTPEQVRDMWS